MPTTRKRNLTPEELDALIAQLQDTPEVDPKQIRYIKAAVTIGRQLTSVGADASSARWAFNNLMAATALTFPADAIDTHNIRMEGNAVAALAFRNGPIEDFHTEGKPLSDKEMKKLNIYGSRTLTGILALRNVCMNMGTEGEEFWKTSIMAYHSIYCSHWEHIHQPPKD